MCRRVPFIDEVTNSLQKRPQLSTSRQQLNSITKANAKNLRIQNETDCFRKVALQSNGTPILIETSDRKPIQFGPFLDRESNGMIDIVCGHGDCTSRTGEKKPLRRQRFMFLES